MPKESATFSRAADSTFMVFLIPNSRSEITEQDMTMFWYRQSLYILKTHS